MLTTDLPEATASIAAATLTGDIRDFMLGQAKRNSKKWDDRSEREQQTFIDACNIAAEDVARKAVKEVSARGFEAIEFSWGTIQIKDGAITAQAKFDGSIDNLRAMMGGGRAVIVFARPLDFFGERAPVRATPDQADLMDNIDVSEGPDTDEDGEIVDGAGQSAQNPADGLAAQQQADALTGAGDPLGPEAQANADRLAGIQPLKTSETDPIGEGAPPKRRGRRSAEERVAANAAAVGEGASADQAAAR